MPDTPTTPADEFGIQKWLSEAKLSERQPERETGRFWTAGDGSVIAVAREMDDGKGLYIETIDASAPESPGDET